MKKIIIRTIAALSLFASLSLATAQAQGLSRTTFKAPFDFTVGNQSFPAGDYSLQFRVNDDPFLLRISDAQNHVTAFLRTYLKDGQTTSRTDKVIFRRYNNEYFLGEIWSSDEQYGLELLKGRTEKNLIKKLTSKDHLASASAAEPFERIAIATIR